MSPVHKAVKPFICSMRTVAIRSGNTSSTPKISFTAEKGAALGDIFSRETQSEEQLAWRAVSNKLLVNVMLRKYSLHPNKRRQITDYLNKKITQLDANDIFPHTEKRKSDEELATC